MPEAWDPRTLPTAFWWLVGFVAAYMAWLARWDILDFVVGMWMKWRR